MVSTPPPPDAPAGVPAPVRWVLLPKSSHWAPVFQRTTDAGTLYAGPENERWLLREGEAARGTGPDAVTLAVVPHSEPGVANGFAWVTLMLVKLDELGVVTRALLVPLSTDAGALVGQFAIHLEAVFDVELPGQLLYVVAGRYIERPLPIALR